MGNAAKTGKPYDFTPIYCVCTDKDVVGQKAEEISFSHLSGLTFPDIHVGDTISVSHDQRGFMEEIFVVEKSSKPPQTLNVKINN